MASSEPASGKVLAREIAAYTDAELDEYLEKHSLEDGTVIVQVHDPENLPESFIYRLRAWAARTSDTAPSRPLDLDLLNARLLQVSDGSAPQRAPPPVSLSETPECTPPPMSLEDEETRYYNELVDDGGRPFYPIGLVDKIAKDPSAHQDMLRPWLERPGHDPPQWEVFQAQSADWKEFRRWQQQNRRPGRPRPADKGTRRFRFADKAHDLFVQHFACNAPDYPAALAAILAQYGFTRSFQLKATSAGEQDKLTTWIEYLGYACAVHFRYTQFIKKRQTAYCKAWEMLQASGLLKPSDTEEEIRDLGQFHFKDELAQARREVKQAKSAVNSALKTPGSGSQTTLAAAQSSLDAAEQALRSLEKRIKYIWDFKDAFEEFWEAENGIKHRAAIIQWIKEQMNEVEEEMKGNRPPESSPPSATHPPRQTNQTTNTQTLEAPQKDNHPNPQAANAASDPEQTKQPPKRPRHSSTTAAADERPFKRAKIEQRTRTAKASKNKHKAEPVNGTRRSRRLAGDSSGLGML